MSVCLCESVHERVCACMGVWRCACVEVCMQGGVHMRRCACQMSYCLYFSAFIGFCYNWDLDIDDCIMRMSNSSYVHMAMSTWVPPPGLSSHLSLYVHTHTQMYMYYKGIICMYTHMHMHLKSISTHYELVVVANY